MKHRVPVVALICVGALLLLLLGSSPGDVRLPWKSASASHVEPLASVGRPDSPAARSQALGPARVARLKHGPALARRRALNPRRPGFAPAGGEGEPSGTGPAPNPAALPAPAAAPAQPPASADTGPGRSPAVVKPPSDPAPAPDPAPAEPEPQEPAQPQPEPPGEPAPPAEPEPPAPAPPIPVPPPPPAVEPAQPVPPQTQAPKPPALPLFDGVAIDDFPEIQAAPGAISEVADPLGSGETVLKMTVDDADVAPITPTENPRAQALSPAMIDPGEEFWLATKFMLPEDFPASVPGWLALVEVYGRPFDGPSPWGIGISHDEFTWQRNGTYDYDIPWRMPLVRERWVHVLLHERFAADGWVEMWIDGRKVTFFPGSGKNTERLAMATMDASNHASPNVAKIMNYRELGMFETVSVYFGALRIGETHSSVTG